MEDKDNVVPGHGILLAMAHPPAVARHKHKRAKRAAATWGGIGAGTKAKSRAQQQQFHGYWPAEFDHLLMGPGTEEAEGAKGAGKDRGGKADQQKGQGTVVVNRVRMEGDSEGESRVRVKGKDREVVNREADGGGE